MLKHCFVDAMSEVDMLKHCFVDALSELDMLKHCFVDALSEMDMLKHCFVDALSEIDVLKHSATQLEASIIDKEREIQRRVQAVHEDEWQKLHKVESEKFVKY